MWAWTPFVFTQHCNSHMIVRFNKLFCFVLEALFTYNSLLDTAVLRLNFPAGHWSTAGLTYYCGDFIIRLKYSLSKEEG